MNPNCPLYFDGKCGKDRRRKCKPATREWFEYGESFGIIDENDMCWRGSPFGNFYIQITNEDIEALKSGKILSFLDKYGIFVGFVEDSEEATDGWLLTLIGKSG